MKSLERSMRRRTIVYFPSEHFPAFMRRRKSSKPLRKAAKFVTQQRTRLVKL